MGSLHSFDPSGPAVPDLPPISIAALAVGLADLLGRACDLPQPQYVTLSPGHPETFTLQFPPDPASIPAITSWAQRFGGVIGSALHQGKTGPETWVRAVFDFYDVTVTAYAHVPVQTGDSTNG